MVTRAKPPLTLIWQSFRDTAGLAALTVAIFCFQQLAHGRSLKVPNGRVLLVALAVFAIAWLATLIACALGGTTASDAYPRGPSGPQRRLPTSFVIAILTGFIASIVFLIAGLFV
jgi:hypothetical protein